jgi:hypothetical protein
MLLRSQTVYLAPDGSARFLSIQTIAAILPQKMTWKPELLKKLHYPDLEINETICGTLNRS